MGGRFKILLSFLKMAGLPSPPFMGDQRPAAKKSYVADVVRLYQILGENMARIISRFLDSLF